MRPMGMNQATAITALRVQIKQLAAAAAEVTYRDLVVRQQTREDKAGRKIPVGSPLGAFDQIARNLAAPALQALSVLTGEDEFRDWGGAAAEEKNDMSNTNDSKMTQEELDAEIKRLQARAEADAAARREAKDAEEKAKAEAFKRQQVERVETDLKEAVRLTWAGTPDAFEEAWPSMREKLLAEKSIADMKTARSDFGHMIRGMF